MYSKTRTKLGIISESCKLSEHLVASLAKVEKSLAIRHIAEYVYRLAPAVRYCRTRAETVGVEVDILKIIYLSFSLYYHCILHTPCKNQLHFESHNNLVY
mgnify:CR=1 FL=1